MGQMRWRFARAVRELRTERGWSQEELADRAGLHRTYVSGVERGLRNVSLDNIEKVATALDVRVSHLFATAEAVHA
jgi:transcriptional regulator with XRE-family HTH domain